MAKCPKCNKPIPWYKSITHTRWTGVKCSFCGTRSFIKRKDFYLWGFLPTLVGALSGLLIFVLFKPANDILPILLGIFIAALFYFTVGWNSTKLEMPK